jgi:hypothetical protein
MDPEAFLKATAGQKEPTHEGAPVSQLQRVINSAARQACSMPRAVEQPALSRPNVALANPGDLVARAFAILAEETKEWQTRRAPNFSRESRR